MEFGKTTVGSELLFIIEEGQFNLGNFDKAVQFIELAGKTGANCIEFQLAYADDFYIRSEAGHSAYKTREFDDSQLKALVDYSKEQGLEFVATCLSHRLVEKMASFGCTGFNLNASDINNTIIIDRILETDKPFFVSLPLATVEEIKWTSDYIERQKPSAKFAFLHGQHSMASGKESVDFSDTSLGFIQALHRQSGRPVGFIDHTANYWTPAVAVAAGAQVISKHMTISHLFKGPDWQICLDPKEMKHSIEMAKEAYQSISTVEKVLAGDELIDRSVMRRSIVSAREILKGQTLAWADITFKRPGTGIPPSSAESLVGKTAITDISADIVINESMFK
jgi:N,N'-diacetyllegionaminate synthase